MKRLLVAIAAFVGAGVSAAPVLAVPTIYEFSGQIDAFADPNGLLGLANVVGRNFSGTIVFGPEDIDASTMNGPDRIGDIRVENLLTVSTPNDQAFVGRQGSDTLFSGILPMSPIAFTSPTLTRTCSGAGGVTLIGTSQMRFSLSCSAFQFNGASPGFAISGAGSYAASSAVPEPATWITMILGIGMVGCFMRRRRWMMDAAIS